MNVTLIETAEDLQRFVDTVSREPFIAVDTEFVRKSTYYPKLGLIQIAFSDHIYLIDAQKCSLSLLKPILFDESVLKVFHSCRQDFEIFYLLYGELPFPIFDLQIAANTLGLYRQASLDQLCTHFLDQPLDKTLQDANWLKRPLDPDMLHYAAQDALTIYKLYPYLKDGAHDVELKEIYDAVIKQDAVEKIYQRACHNLKDKTHLKYIKEIILWRENFAKKIDVPREHFLNYNLMETLIKEIPLTREVFKRQLFREKLRDLAVRKKEYREHLWNFLRDLPEKKVSS